MRSAESEDRVNIAGSDDKGSYNVELRNGEIVRRVEEKEIVDALMEEVARWEADNAAKLPKATDVEGIGRRKLPVVTG